MCNFFHCGYFIFAVWKQDWLADGISYKYLGYLFIHTQKRVHQAPFWRTKNNKMKQTKCKKCHTNTVSNMKCKQQKYKNKNAYDITIWQFTLYIKYHATKHKFERSKRAVVKIWRLVKVDSSGELPNERKTSPTCAYF